MGYTLSDGDWRDRGPRAALDLERLHDEGELGGAGRGELLELQIFQQIDAVLNDHHGVHGQAVARLRWPHLDTAIVGCHHERVLSDQPLRSRDAQASVFATVAL